MYFNRLHSRPVAGGFVSNFRPPESSSVRCVFRYGDSLAEVNGSTIFNTFVNMCIFINILKCAFFSYSYKCEARYFRRRY